MTKLHVTTVLLATMAVAAASACGPRRVTTPAPSSGSLVVLLADADGTVGRATVSNEGRSVDLAADRDGTVVAMNQPPRAAAAVAETEVQRVFGDALAVLPPAPQQFILQFQFDSDELTAEGRRLLPDIIRSVTERPVPEVDVIGHTDSTGAAASNVALGLKRAASVRELLVKAGLDASLIDVRSHGESDPLVRTADNTYEAKNRRVEVLVR
jgi:outer membrane protein OmpA-like peptidoglycan-associated protein